MVGATSTSTTTTERFSIVVVANDFKELNHNLLTSDVAKSTAHELVVIDNRGNRISDNICELYCDAMRRVANDLVFFMHQDVFIPDQWDEKVVSALIDLEQHDPQWGVVGPVGAAFRPEDDGRWITGHWADPSTEGWTEAGPLPARVQSLDELCLGLRKSRGISFDPKLPGFHCYGMDLSLTARDMGFSSWAIDAPLWHKYRDRQGARITRKEESLKSHLRDRPEFIADYEAGKRYVGQKWSRYLPFRSTSTSWD